MRIALFIPGFGGGGAECVFIALANYWVSNGHFVDYLVCRNEGPMRTRLDERVNVVELRRSKIRLLRRAFYAYQVSRYCRVENPELLVSTLSYCNQIAASAKMFFGIGGTCLVIREANSLSNFGKLCRFQRFLNRVSMRILYHQANWVSANSRNTLDELAQECGVIPQKMVLVRNPVVMHPVTVVEPTKPPVILGSGRLIPQKDFATLVRSFAVVRKSLPCRLIILGEGPEREGLLALARELSIPESDLELPGFVNDPGSYYTKASVFVLPSLWEGLPNVVLEALSYGLPVVATDCVGGTREIFKGVEARHLVQVGDFEEMAQRILLFLRKQPPNEEMQGVLSGRFDLDSVASSYLALANSGRSKSI